MNKSDIGGRFIDLTLKEKRAINRELGAIGDRICEACGERHPLTIEFFYATTRGGYTYRCILCLRLEASLYQQEKRKDKEFRKLHVQRTKASNAKKPEARRAQKRKEYRRNARKQFQKILGRES